MQKLQFDTGIQEYQLNDRGVLRFNPSDPNVYKRFLEIIQNITALEASMEAKLIALEEAGVTKGEQVIALMYEVDATIKMQLQYAFGAENDFDKLLGGINLMAVGENDERVITNFFAVLMPLVSQGAKTQLKAKAAKAIVTREQKRAAAKRAPKTIKL